MTRQSSSTVRIETNIERNGCSRQIDKPKSIYARQTYDQEQCQEQDKTKTRQRESIYARQTQDKTNARNKTRLREDKETKTKIERGETKWTTDERLETLVTFEPVRLIDGST